MKKLIRLTTISSSLKGLLKGQLRYFNKCFQFIGVALGLDSLKELKEQEKVKTYEIKMSREISLVQDLKSLFTLIRYIAKPYIVHANTLKPSLLSMIAAWTCRVPHRIYTVTGLRFETTSGWFRKLLVFLEKTTCAIKVIPEGEGVKRTSKPLQVILNGNVTDINRCNEIIIERKNGVIIPSQNRKALLEQIIYFITKPTALE